MAAQNPADVYARKAENMLETSAEKVGETRERLNALYERGKDRAMEWEGNFENYVSDRPVRSILIAAGIGLLIGALLARR